MKSSLANRGMPFENLIEFANGQYENAGVALIHKRPTPVKVIRTKGNQILKAVYDRKSTVDFDGVYKGRAIYFEAKSTTNKTSFKLDMVQPHQVHHLEKAHANGALCFLLVEFSLLRKVFYLPIDFFLHAVLNASMGGRKSIPIGDLEEYCHEVRQTKRAVLDYLAIIDEIG